MTVSPLQVSCLGRPFQLGMLYDCYNDNLISEVTLWDSETLKNHLSCTKKFTSNHEILDSDMLNEKYNYLDITGDLKLSCLLGLIKISGAACFLKEVPSPHQIRVCFKYWSNLKYEELLTDQLLDVSCTQATSTSATHVVTGISYGADAIFMFDYPLQKNEDKQKIIKFMKNIVENFPYIYFDVNDDIKCNLDILDEEKINKISCKIYTDIHLNNPTTFRDAIKAYKLLCEQSSDSNYIVPKKAWLYPLKKLKIKEFNTYVEINASSISAIQSVIQNLTLLELKISDLKLDDTSVTFVVFEKELNRFAMCIIQYKMALLYEAGVLVPEIRSGKKAETELLNLLQTYTNSIFNTKSLDAWLDDKKCEIDTIKIFLHNVQEVEHAFLYNELDEAIDNLEYDYIICFEFNVCGRHDEYLEQLYNFSQSRYLNNLKLDQLNPAQPWYKDHAIKAKIRAQLKKFKTFFDANKNKPGTKYLLTHHIDEQQNEGATIRLYEQGAPEIFSPPEKCSKPHIVTEFHDSLEIKWNPLNCYEIENYIVFYRENDNILGSWMKHETTDISTTVTITNLQPNTTYRFKVCANCKVGLGEESDLSDEFKTKTHISNTVADFKKYGKLIKAGNPDIVQIPLTHEYESKVFKDNEESHEKYLLDGTDDIIIMKYSVGQDKTFYTDGSEKVLMILGATGAGKTTLINSMINYLFGITFQDDFRLQLISENSGKSQAHSQTRCITSYTIYKMKGFKLPYPLTIVDTPGYGDTEGLQRDKVITKQIRTFFSQSDEHGIKHLNGVGFVAQSALARLTKTQEYIFDSILSLFGKDVKQNIFIMVTFADAQRPPVLDAIDKAQIQYNKYYTFNNSAIFADKTPQNENFTQLFWEMGNKSFEAFFSKFGMSKEVSLVCTRKVLDKRNQLDANVYAIQRKIELGVAKIEELEKEKKIMYTHQAKIDANQKFTYTMCVTKQRQVFVTPGTFVTNCVKCNFTCHYPCYIPNDKEKFRCAAMENQCDPNTKCRVCTNHCSWEFHFNNGYVFELYDDTETRTSDDLKKKYQEGIEGKKTVQAMIDSITREIDDARDDVRVKMKNVQDCLAELNKIALRTNPLTEEQYLEMLIRSENEQKKAGYLERIKFYHEALQDAQIISIVKGSTIKNMTSEKYKRVMDFSNS